MGRFDHLIPQKSGNRFSHLIPAPQAMEQAPSLAGIISDTLAAPMGGPVEPFSVPTLPAMGESPIPTAQRAPLSLPADPMQAAIALSRPEPGPDFMETPPEPFNPTADTAMGDLMAGWLGLKQIPGAMDIAGGAKQLARSQDITRAMELAAELGFEISPEDAAAAVDRQTQLSERGADAITGALPGVMDLGRQAAEIPINPAAAEAMQADTWGESIAAAMEDPAGVARTFALRSLPPSAPTALAAVLGSIGGPLGAAAGAGVTSGVTDYAMTIAQEIAPLIAEAGVDPNDGRAVEMFMRSNPDAVAGMIEDAARRGATIGAFDAAAGGVGGLLARWAAAGGGARKVAATGVNVAADPALGGAGETAAGGSPGDVLAEVVGGATIGGPTELGQILVEALKQPGATPAPAPQAPTPPAAPEPEMDLAALLETFITPPEPPADPTPIPGAPPDTDPLPPVETPPPVDMTAPQPEETPTVTAPAPIPPSLPVDAGDNQRPVVEAPPDAGVDFPADDAPPAEPPTAQRRPFTTLLRRNGISIDPDTPGGRDLAAAGITTRSHPGLIRRGAGHDFDNLPAEEYPEIAALVGVDGMYLDRQGLIDAIMEETPTPEQDAVAVVRRDWERMQSEAKGRIAAAPPLAISRPDFAPQNEDIDAGPVRRENIRKAVVQAQNAGAPITTEERARIIDFLDANGGAVEYAIELEIIRSVLDAEAGEPVNVDAFASIPGFDEPAGGVAAAGGGRAGEQGRVGVQPAAGEERAGQDGLAGEGAEEGRVDGGRDGPSDVEGSDRGAVEAGRGEPGAAPDRARARAGTEGEGSIDLTPEGRQQVIPGAEKITDRERAERQMAKPKRGGSAPPDEDGLFGDPANRVDLFDEPRQDGGASSLEAKPTVPRQSTEASGAPHPRSKSEASSSSRDAASETPARPATQTVKDAGDTTGRKPRGRLSPKFLDFSFTDRPSVYGAAFRAAGLEPGDALSLPMERQIAILRGVLKDRFGIEVELPTLTVRKKNLVGRIISTRKQEITTVEAVDQMLDAFRNLQMLASIMGVPAKAMALEIDGKPLTLSLRSRRRMGPLGMFSWGDGTRTIHLPGRSNSFAHEWGHALDHYLGAVGGKDIDAQLLTRVMDRQGVQPPLSPRRALIEAFAGIMHALYADKAKLSALILELQRIATEIGKDGKPTTDARRAADVMLDIKNGKRPPAAYLNRYFATSKAYDDAFNGGQGYFQDPAEMFARAFEAWVGVTVSSISDLPQGFMSKGGWAYQTDQDERLALTFPKGADALTFAAAMADLQHAITRVALFGRDAPADRPDDVDIFSDKAMLLRLPRQGVAARERQELQESVRALKASVTHAGDRFKAVAGIGAGVWYGYLTSLTAAMHAVANRQTNPEARRAFQNIADMMGNDPGAGRLIRHVYQQDVEMSAKRNLRKMDHALISYTNHRQMTPEETKTLRSLLIGERVQATAEMRELAGKLRAILKGIWYELKKAGLEVGYADSYLPRIPNKEEIATDPQGFMHDAAKVYASMFQKEVIENDDPETQTQDINTVIRGLRAARMPTPEGETLPASRLSEADETMIEEWRAARQKLRRLQRQAETDPLNTKIGDKIHDAEAEVERLTELVLDMLKERFADYSAENWHTRMFVGDSNDFDTMGPSGSFLKGRVLSQEADVALTRWLQHDPIELIAGYTFSAARRAEYAKRFGPTGEKLENMLSAAVKAGADGNDVSLVRQAINSAAGRFRHPNRGGEQLATTFFFIGTMAMLGRATFASLAEPLTAGLRTGNVADSGRAFISAVRSLLPGKHKEDLFELAKVIGLTTSAMRETVMANRLSADSAGLTKGMSLTLAKFFNRSLLTPLTNFQNAAMMPAAHAVIMRHLRSWEKGGRGKGFAGTELNELGIAEDERADLLQWLEGLQGMPKPDDLLAPDGSFYNQAADLWANATVRMVNSIIQNPQKSDRPIMANHPMVAALYGIMSFSMSFHRNILVRNVRRMAKAENKPLLAANVTAAVGVLFAGQFLATVIREALFNPDMWEQKDEDDELLAWLMRRAFSRTGLTGVFDPFVQLATGIKYERDLAAAAAGPYAGYMLQNAQRILEAFVGRNSPNTNTAEWNAARAFYQMAIQPAFMGAATLLPGGPVTGLPSTAAIWWGSSPEASARFADMMAGEKMKDGETYKKRGEDQPWWELGD